MKGLADSEARKNMGEEARGILEHGRWGMRPRETKEWECDGGACRTERGKIT